MIRDRYRALSYEAIGLIIDLVERISVGVICAFALPLVVALTPLVALLYGGLEIAAYARACEEDPPL